jgi:PadR family transcriptional regulator, regulatory protein PadR
MGVICTVHASSCQVRDGRTTRLPIDTSRASEYERRRGAPVDDTAETTAGRISGFGLAPPRRFILPAILLLLSERSGYGYGLVPQLREFGFGHVDRPAVYRALAQLEHDELVEASAENPTAGQTRRVYRVTPLGERVLRVWMGVLKEEHENLGEVLRRYRATGTADAVLAEIEGGWALALRSGLSSVSPSIGRRRHLVPFDLETIVRGPGEAGEPEVEPVAVAGEQATPRCRRYLLCPERSVVLVDVRSTVGPLSFGALGITGAVEAAVGGGTLVSDVPPSARLHIDVSGLRSGNSLYDVELARRIDARRFPSAVVELGECTAVGPGARYRLRGSVTFHGVTRSCEGTVQVEASANRLIVTGEQTFDMRDFAMASPTVLMLRIYPDIRVRLHVEAELDEG